MKFLHYFLLSTMVATLLAPSAFSVVGDDIDLKDDGKQKDRTTKELDTYFLCPTTEDIAKWVARSSRRNNPDFNITDTRKLTQEEYDAYRKKPVIDYLEEGKERQAGMPFPLIEPEGAKGFHHMGVKIYNPLAELMPTVTNIKLSLITVIRENAKPKSALVRCSYVGVRNGSKLSFNLDAYLNKIHRIAFNDKDGLRAINPGDDKDLALHANRTKYRSSGHYRSDDDKQLIDEYWTDSPYDLKISYIHKY